MIIRFLITLFLLNGNLLAQEVITSAYEQKTIHLPSPNPDLPSIDLRLNTAKIEDQEKRELMNVVKGVDLIFSTKAYEKNIDPKSAFCNYPKGSIEHSAYLGNESISPFVLYQIQIPINTLAAPTQSFSLKMNSGNTLVHDTILTDQNNGTQRINFDAVTEKDSFAYTQPLGDKTEAFVILSFYSVSERGLLNPLNWAVSDGFIEAYHKTILGRDDVYGRKELGYDHFAYQASDQNGNVFSLDKGKVYAFPLQLGVTQYQVIQESNKSLMSINGTAAIQIPLSVVGPQGLDAAVGGTFSATKKVNDKNSFTGALHGSVQFHEIGNMTKRTDVYSAGTANPTYQVQALMGFNHLGNNGNINSYYVTYNRGTLRMNDLKLTATGGPLNQQALQAATSGSEYLEVGVNKTFNLKNAKRLQIELAIREDVYSSFNETNTLGGHSLFVGRNAEDFGVFVGVRYQLGKRKKPKIK